MKKLVVISIVVLTLSACSTTYKEIDNSADTMSKEIDSISADIDKLNREHGLPVDDDENTSKKNSASKLYDKYIY